MPRIGGSTSAPGASGNEIVRRRTRAQPDKAVSLIIIRCGHGRGMATMRNT